MCVNYLQAGVQGGCVTVTFRQVSITFRQVFKVVVSLTITFRQVFEVVV